MLKVEAIHAGYQGVEVLHGVDLEIKQGEIVSLVGSNGAGKTTLIRTLSGVVRAVRGTIWFEGEKVTHHSTDQLVARGIVHVPESRLLFPPLSVEENLLLGTAGKGKKYRKEKMEERMEFVFNLFPVLKQRLRQQAGTLSGGEQQMLAIGRGLMAEPRLLMLDEPSLGLAPKVVEKIFEVVKKLNEDGMTIFLVEQNVSMALEFSDRAYVLELGNITASGSGKELLNDERIKEAYLG